MAGQLSLNNPVFKAFLTHAVVVVGKTMLMSSSTIFQRFKNLTFANPEDWGMKGDKQKATLTNPDVERGRRCHLNDLENVIPFVLIGLLYVTTSPDLSTALLHFRIFTGARLFHTIAYLLPIRQPARALSFFVGYLTTFSMAYSVASAAGFTF